MRKKFSPLPVKIDFAVTKMNSPSVVSGGAYCHSQDIPVKGAGTFNITDGQHQVIEGMDLHLFRPIVHVKRAVTRQWLERFLQ